MYRIAVCLLCLGGMTFGIVGCAEKTKVEKTTKVQTPGGTDTKTITIEEKKTGDQKENAAPNP